MNKSDIVGWDSRKPVKLSKFNQQRAALIRHGWHVSPIIDKITTPCPTCNCDTVVFVILTNDDRNERMFEVCFTCGTATEQKPIFADGKPA